MGHEMHAEASSLKVAEEPRTRQQREMARLWMALNAVRQAETRLAQPRAMAPVLAGIRASDLEGDRRRP
jgi:hypothetical protein